MNVPAAMHVDITADAIRKEDPDEVVRDRAACEREMLSAFPQFIRHLNAGDTDMVSRGYYFGLRVASKMVEMGMAI